jgi:hypothetical protein
MQDLFGEAKRRLASKIDSCSLPSIEPIAADPWIVSSLLQKSIRRGETEIAQRAALTLLKWRGSAIWRRFMVIAFEDIGIGSTDALIMTVAAGSDAAWRESAGGNARIAAALVATLAEAPKDRTTDYIVGAKDHPALGAFVHAMTGAPLDTKLANVRDETLSLPQRAVAISLTCGEGISARSNASVDALLALFRELGVPEDLLTAVATAARRTGEPITLMVPLVWLVVRRSKRVAISDCPVSRPVTIGDVPLYALDEHTRLGREAIWRLARENDELRTCLDKFVSPAQRRRAANVAAFYLDAAPVAKRLVWDQSAALETFGIERDLLHAGVAAEGIHPLLQVMRENLGQLNELRAKVLTRTRTAAPPSRMVAS